MCAPVAAIHLANSDLDINEPENFRIYNACVNPFHSAYNLAVGLGWTSSYTCLLARPGLAAAATMACLGIGQALCSTFDCCNFEMLSAVRGDQF